MTDTSSTGGDNGFDSADDAINDRIRRRAHEIWESEGHPHGRDRDHWEQAVAEIRAELGGRAEPGSSKADPTRAAAESLSAMAGSDASVANVSASGGQVISEEAPKKARAKPEAEKPAGKAAPAKSPQSKPAPSKPQRNGKKSASSG